MRTIKVTITKVRPPFMSAKVSYIVTLREVSEYGSVTEEHRTLTYRVYGDYFTRNSAPEKFIKMWLSDYFSPADLDIYVPTDPSDAVTAITLHTRVGVFKIEYTLEVKNEDDLTNATT